jgi:5-methylcytosine-specific restriction enzyme A
VPRAARSCAPKIAFSIVAASISSKARCCLSAANGIGKWTVPVLFCSAPVEHRGGEGFPMPTRPSVAWYKSARWQRIRQHQLRNSPFCVYCRERGIARAATVCDHVIPHEDDVNRFWLGPFQSLCVECHNNIKRHEELDGYRPHIGPDGWPIDAKHPCYSRAAQPKPERSRRRERPRPPAEVPDGLIW